MNQTQLRPAPLAKVTGLGIAKLGSSCGLEFSASPALRQGSIDTVAILAARSGVAVATVRAQLAAWQIGGGL